MIPVLSREQMRAFDARAIAECRVPSLILMENAGRGATDVLAAELLEGAVDGKKAVVVCGTGNNGGDGFVVARHLLGRGARVVVWLVGAEERLTSDARTNRDAIPLRPQPARQEQARRAPRAVEGRDQGRHQPRRAAPRARCCRPAPS